MGVTLNDSAVLSGGNSPTGTITFTLVYNSTTVDTETVTVTGNGTYSTPTGYTLPTTGTVTGTYQWNAAYSGDVNNNAAIENNDPSEAVVVSAANPNISTTPAGTVTVGDGHSMTDTAVLSGGYHPTGTITFTLKDPSNTTVDTETVTVNGNGTYSTPTGYVPVTPDVYTWSASYSGDTNNTAATDNGQNETETALATQCVSPPSNLIHWWPGDKNADDIQGANFGTLKNGAGFAGGEVGEAFNFTASQNQYVDVGFIHLHNTFTIDAWVNAADLSIDREVVSDLGTGNGYNFEVESDGRLLLNLANGGSQTVYETDPGFVTAGSWHHVAVTYDSGAAAGSRATFYVDGSRINSFVLIEQNTGPGNSNRTLKIGIFSAPPEAYNNPWNGQIDEVELFTRALTADEVATIYAANHFGKCKTVCFNPPDNLVGWWPGDGDTKDVANGNNGLLKNGATFAAGEVQQAFSFNGGTAQEVDVPHDNDQNPGAQITVDAWIFPNSNLESISNSHASIINKRTPGNSQGYAFELDNENVSNGLRFEMQTSNGGFAMLVPNATTPNVWQHVAVTYDGNTVTMYVNGVAVASQGKTGTINAVTNDLIIGRNIVNGQSFPGLIDEVELFNRALTQGEIDAIYSAGANGKCKPACTDPPTGLIDWWPGDNTAADIQGMHNGTLKNGATFANGKVDGAFQFDGQDDYVDLGIVDLSSVSTFSVDAWINPNDISNAPIIIQNFDFSNGIAVSINGGYLFIDVFGPAGHTSYRTHDPLITTGTWQHVVVTYDGNAAAGQRVTFYINGAPEQADNSGNDAGGTPGSSTATMQIGGLNGIEQQFNGRIDEVELFNRVLTASEAQGLYDAGTAGKCKRVRYYVSNNGNNTIEKFDDQGNDLGTFADGSSSLNAPNGLAFDASGNLFVGNRGGQNVLKFDPAGNHTVFVDGPTKGFSCSYGLAFDLSGDLFLPDDCLNIEFKFTSAAAGGAFTAAHLSIPTDETFDSSGLLYILNNSDRTIQTFNASTAAYQGQFATTINRGISLRFSTSGELYASEGNAVQKFDSTGNSLGVFASAPDSNSLFGIVFDPIGNLYAASNSSNAIFKFDPSGATSTFASAPTANLNAPRFIATQLL